VEVDREVDVARMKALGDGILASLADVRAAVEDWKPMRSRMAAIVAELEQVPKGLDPAETAENREFLAWVEQNHFTFLGYRDYELVAVNGEDQLRIVPRSGLGVLREPVHGGYSQGFTKLPAELRSLAREARLLVLTKANTRAKVHRPG
jgi:glutamate dehydrogenase